MGFFLFYFLCLVGMPLFSHEAADAFYHKGEQAQTVAERREAFNQALRLYAKLEENHPESRSAALYYNIGNVYFQLGEYPWAILNYYRALNLSPRNEKILRNLNITLEKIGLPEYKQIKPTSYLFFFHNLLSFLERLQILAGLSLLILILLSLYIWGVRYGIKKLLIVLLFCWVVMLLSICYSHYFSPIEGVLVENTALYRDAGEQYAKVSEKPIREGNKLTVLDVVHNGKWLKVLTPEGKVGYIPNKAIRIISY